MVVSWVPEAHALLCTDCKVDAQRESAREAEPLTAPLVTFSPAALRAMGGAR